MDKEIVARRLSGARGKSISASEIVYAGREPEVGGIERISVEMSDGTWWTLLPGNEAYGGPDDAPEYWKNGARVEHHKGIDALVAKMAANVSTK